MEKVLIIGAGGVGRVVAHKCAQVPEVFGEIHLASRSPSKCEKIKQDVRENLEVDIQTYQLDAEIKEDMADLLKRIKPTIAVNVALPYQNLPIMEACLEARVNYMDTAIDETRDRVHYDYNSQRRYHEQFKKKGLTALLGCGFDPGASNAYCAYAQKNLFDTIKTIDILDCNAGNHGQHFMPNFNPEINIREVTQKAKYWENGRWIVMPSILDEDALHFTFDYPVVGKNESYLLYHEEEQSLVENIDGLARIRFWMTFTPNYLKHLSVLKNVGMTSIEPIQYEGNEIVPLKFLQAVLPKSGEVSDRYTGKTSIGCLFNGTKDGKNVSRFIYNICDHEESYRETGIHAVAYTTGVPAMVAAKLITEEVWKNKGVLNVEQFNPDPFMEGMTKYGLPWNIVNGKNYLKTLPK
jgi:saccharopine dehydrogenase (NAD+, L-lysine-forming)